MASPPDLGELYRGALLSPMVRCGTLPLRLLSLEYGAHAVYTHELIDRKLMGSKRVETTLADGSTVVDFVREKDGALVFRTCAAERERVICQIGSANAEYALQAAQLVAGDVAAIDLNMGCPKHFSIQGGMGAALLRTPEVACDIIRALRTHLTIPVSCKIRILETPEATITLVKALVAAGACAVGVHLRETHERPKDRAHWERLKAVVDAVPGVPIVANGDVWVRADVDAIMKLSGCAGVMVARGALRNPSLFRAAGALPLDSVVRRYLDVARAYDFPFTWRNSKYCVQQLMRENKVLGCDLGCDLTRTKTGDAVRALWAAAPGRNGGIDAAIIELSAPKGLFSKRLRASARSKGGAPVALTAAEKKASIAKWRRVRDEDDADEEEGAGAAAGGKGGASARKRRKVSASDVVGAGPEAGPASSAPAAGPAADAAPGAAVLRYTVAPSATCALNAALRIELEFVAAAALLGRRVHWRFHYVVDAVRQAASPRIALGRSDTHFCDDRPATVVFDRATFLKTTEGSTKAALRNVGLIEACLHGEEDAADAAPMCACAVVVEVKGGDEMNGGDASVLVRTCFPRSGGGTAAAAAAVSDAAAHA
jgi:tRNA-dihydrouridine synthase